MTPLLIDHRTNYLTGAAAPASVLTIPLGTSSVLDQLLDRLERATDGTPLVLVPPDAPADYEQALRASTHRATNPPHSKARIERVLTGHSYSIFRHIFAVPVAFWR